MSLSDPMVRACKPSLTMHGLVGAQFTLRITPLPVLPVILNGRSMVVQPVPKPSEDTRQEQSDTCPG